MRENASNWLELADKVYHYRRDVLPAADLAELQAQTAGLRRLVKERADTMKLKLGIESLEHVLRRTGGSHYPKRSITENVEFFLVAAIVILGFRTYFLQPFKIPTNSMWPSYYGMTAENLPPGTEAPGAAERIFRLAAFGAQRREAIAPQAGEVSADFFESGAMAYQTRAGRNWLIFPAIVRDYTFYVGGQTVTISVPEDFHDFDRVLQETYFQDRKGFATYLNQLGRSGRLNERSVLRINNAGESARVVRIPLNRTVKAGESVLRFDILTGDQLFVDRMSYHFVRPSVGQGFVFRTGEIHSPYMTDRQGRQLEQYYIKRLVGVPGDTLEIKDYTLYRNGAPITGAAAFDKNANRTDNYVGYRNELSLAKGQTMSVPPESFLALGDNSANSQDGRYWGYVPAKEAIGRPLFIYYPFTKRWGPSR